MQLIDAALDRLYLMLNGSARNRGASPDAIAMTIALTLAIIAFGFELTNPTLGIDDVSFLAVPFRWEEFWVARGSWGALLVQYLTPGGWITPFISLVIGILLQLLAVVVIGWSLELRTLPPMQQALLYALFVVFPYFACQMAFHYVQIAYSLATFLMACGVLLALAGDAIRAVCAALAIGFAISIYQGSLSVLAPLALLAPFAGGGKEKKEIVRRSRRVLLAVLAGGGIYLATHKLILATTGIVAKSQYYSVSFDWHFWERLRFIRSEIEFLFLGAGDVIPAKVVAIFLLAALLWMLHAVARERGALRRLQWLALYLVLAALLVVSPFMVLFVHDGQLAPRSSVGVAVVWIALFASMLAASSIWIRRAGTACLGVVILFFLFQDNRMFFSQHLITRADIIMMARIAERIDQLGVRSDAGATDVVFIGQYSQPEYEGMPRFSGAALGHSQFEWELNGDDARWRIRGLAKAIGVDHYAWPGSSDLGEAFHDPLLLRDRQPWPHSSSVFAHDGYAVVWLGHRREESRSAPLQVWFDAVMWNLFGV